MQIHSIQNILLQTLETVSHLPLVPMDNDLFPNTMVINCVRKLSTKLLHEIVELWASLSLVLIFPDWHATSKHSMSLTPIKQKISLSLDPNINVDNNDNNEEDRHCHLCFAYRHGQLLLLAMRASSEHCHRRMRLLYNSFKVLPLALKTHKYLTGTQQTLP